MKKIYIVLRYYLRQRSKISLEFDFRLSLLLPHLSSPSFPDSVISLRNEMRKIRKEKKNDFNGLKIYKIDFTREEEKDEDEEKGGIRVRND